MSNRRAADVRELLAQKDTALALTLESALNDELIRRCQRLHSVVHWLAEYLAAEADATSSAPGTYPPSFWIEEAERSLKEAASEQAKPLTHTAGG